MSSKLSEEQKTQRWYLLLAPLLFAALIFLVGASHFGQRLENMALDAFFRLRQASDPPASPELVVVAITENDLVQHGRWPWSRSVHADFFTLLAQTPPAVLGFDVLFTEREGDGESDINLSLAALQIENSVLGAMISRRSEIDRSSSFATADTVNESDFGVTEALTRISGRFAPSSYSGERATLPVVELINTSYLGFVDAAPDFDGTKRSVPLVVRIGEKVYPSLSTQMLMRYWGLDNDQVSVHPGEYVEFATVDGIKRAPIDEKGALRINWRNQSRFLSGPGAYSYSNLSQPLLEFSKGKPWPADYRSPEGRIVLVGQSDTEGMTDVGPSPLNPQTPLMLLHINAIDNILKSDYLQTRSFISIAVPWLLIAWLSLLVLGRTNLWLSVLVPLILTAIYLIGAWMWFARDSIALPLVLPTLGFAFGLHGGQTLLRWRNDQRGRSAMKSMFSSYLGPGVMEELMRDPGKINLGGERKPVTILFSDVRDFTTISESMDEESLVAHLNEYFETMVDCVNRFRGTLHKYIGDAIMVVWGDVAWEGVIAMKPSETAENAVRSSLAMLSSLRELNQRWISEDRLPLKIGIGLNFGEVLVGNIGASQRMEFTVIGDAVNVASRLEGQCKSYRAELVIGEPVRELLGPEFIVRSLGLLVLKGKTKPIRASEVLGEDHDCDASRTLRVWAEKYERGFDAYLGQRFDQAIVLFEACLAERPEDFSTESYLQLSRQYLKHPPGADWNGIEVKLDK